MQTVTPEKLEEWLQQIKAINAFCNSPHWTPTRRWEIEKLSRNVQYDIIRHQNKNPVRLTPEALGGSDGRR